MSQASRQPNIVLIVTDDQGAWAVPWNMPELQMPTLATLADNSMVADNAYCTSPVCSPSRASMMTGRIPSAHGVHDWISAVGDPTIGMHFLDGQPIIAELLAEAGYTCAMVGKWHLGDASVPAPGYSFWYAHRTGGGPYVGAPVWRDGERVSEERHFTEAVGDEALHFLAAADAASPYFLHLNFTAPHDPWFGQHPQRLTELYTDTDFPSVPQEDEHPWFAPRRADFADAVADRTGALTGYCALLTGVDEQIARVQHAIVERGDADNTVIMFTADNGFACGHHGIWGKGNGTVPTNFWTSSVKVPFVLYDPRRTLPARLDEPWSTSGIFPTLCALAGIERPDDPWQTGQDVYAVTAGEVVGEAVILDEYGSGRMLRVGPWALMTRPGGPDELYNVVDDPHERTNLIGDPSYHEVAKDLRARLDEQFARLARPGFDAGRRHVPGLGQRLPVSDGRPDYETYVYPADMPPIPPA